MRSRSIGLTLIELLFSLSILAILICSGASFAPALYKKNQLQRVSDEIKGAIQWSRLQAPLMGEWLALTPLPNSHDWSEGMLLFVDNAQHQYKQDTKLLHEWHWNAGAVHIDWQGFQSIHYLLFTPNMSSNVINGHFIMKNTMQQKIKLIVNRLGRVSEKWIGTAG